MARAGCGNTTKNYDNNLFSISHDAGFIICLSYYKNIAIA